MRRLALSLALCLVVVGCGPSASVTDTAAASLNEKPMRVEVGALFKKYQTDLAAAESTYQGKLLTVTGMMAKMQKDDAGRYYLTGPDCRAVVSTQTFSSPAEAAANASYAPGVVCYVDAAGLKDFAGLDQSKTISVRGRCKGSKKDASADPDFIVTLEGCVLAQQRPK